MKLMTWSRQRSSSDQRPEYMRGLPAPALYKDLTPDVPCFVTTRITRDGEHVEFMIHGAPGDDEGDPDGHFWQFFAGDEDQEFLDDPDNIHIVGTNTVANHDPAVVPYLGAPVGSCWVRAGSVFVEDKDE